MVRSDETTQYVLGPGGEQMTEFAVSEGDEIASWKHTNVYGGGRLLATYDAKGTHFHVSDWLGTERAQIGANGVVDETCISFPFGDGLACSGPGTDATEHHFTGKERDAESGLDYFGARYYASAAGRWVSPDWSATVAPIPYAKLDYPQSLNLYAYVGNNPIIMADADGHCDNYVSGSTATCVQDANSNSAADQEAKAYDNIQTSKEEMKKAMAFYGAQQQSQNLSPTDKVALKAEQKALGPTRESVAEKNSHEYGGLIVQNDKSGKISATDPIRGNGISIDVDSIPVPAGTTVIATYHSHPHSSAVEDGGASQGDVNNSAAHNNRPGYVLDSFGGRVYRYDGHTDARPFPAGTYIGTVQ